MVNFLLHFEQLKGFCQCGFFHGSLNYLLDWMSCHTLSSWMVSHQCGFFHESLNHLMLWISCHTLSNLMVSWKRACFLSEMAYQRLMQIESVREMLCLPWWKYTWELTHCRNILNVLFSITNNGWLNKLKCPAIEMGVYFVALWFNLFVDISIVFHFSPWMHFFSCQHRRIISFLTTHEL